MSRRPCNDEECTYNDHPLDHVGLNLVRLVLARGTWSRFTVASHGSCLTTNDDQDATVAENKEEKQQDT